jgi:hypothetical protein
MLNLILTILTAVHATPFVVFGLCLIVIGTTPSGDIRVIYLGTGLAALIGLLLTMLPLGEIRLQRARLLWSLAAVLTVLIAFILPPADWVFWTGAACLLFGLALLLLRYWLLPGLTARQLLRFHVRKSEAIDYVAIFDCHGEALEKIESCPDEGMLRWHLRRFALPGNIDDQVKTWDEIARRLHQSLQNLDQTFRRSGQGENSRVVFDIEMGGFIYTRLHHDRFLFAATLDQSYMNDDSCARDVQRLVKALMARSSAHQAHV